MRNMKKYLLLLPGFAMLAIFMFMPLLSTIMATVEGESLTLARYYAFFTDSFYLTILIRTLRIAIVTTVICAILGVPVAYFISRCDKKYRGILMALSMFPLLTNSVVRSFAWITILGRNGVLNNLLLSLKIIDEPLVMLYTEFSVLIGMIYLFLPLMITTLIGVMENIDNDMLEAAESLGANRFKGFMKVVFPLSIPGIIVGSVLVFTGSLTAYTTPQLLGGNKQMLMATFIYQRATALGDWTGASVIAVIMIVVTFIVMKGLNMLADKLDKRGERSA